MNIETVTCMGCGLAVRLWVGRHTKPYCSVYCRGVSGDRAKLDSQHFEKNRAKSARELMIQTKKEAFKEAKKKQLPSQEFYRSDAWRQLRYKVFARFGRKCMVCGLEGGRLHVDHIKPRVRFPELELDINNLQILCEECNIGKLDIDYTDWRPKWLRDQSKEGLLNFMKSIAMEHRRYPPDGNLIMHRSLMLNLLIVCGASLEEAEKFYNTIPMV